MNQAEEDALIKSAFKNYEADEDSVRLAIRAAHSLGLQEGQAHERERAARVCLDMTTLGDFYSKEAIEQVENTNELIHEIAAAIRKGP